MDDFITYEGRLFIPVGLRPDALANLHIGHQARISRIARAAETLYWPGLVEDIRRFRETRTLCHENAPSQPKEPQVPLPEPEFPFESICLDFMELHGNRYLVSVHQFSG